MRLIAKGVLLLFVFASMYLSYSYGQQVPFSSQWPLFEALRTTASIIFAVVGAWLAIIYPERLKLTFRAGSKADGGAPVKMGQLLHPAMHSTAILCVVLLVGITAPLLRQVPFLADYRDVCRGLSYCLATALTYWQIWTVVLTLVPADMIKSYSDRENLQGETMSLYRRNHAHRDRKGSSSDAP